MIYLITALHRPQDVENVFHNWCRQRVVTEIIVVENGAAIGAMAERAKRPEWEPFLTVLQSPPHQSHAKNAAIRWIAKNVGPDNIWATFDADDYYGPDYAGEMFCARSKGTLWGKSEHFLTTQTGQVRLIRDFPQDSLNYDYLHGATLCGWVRDGHEFRVTGRQGEDWDLVMRTVANGGSLYSTSRNNYIWRRDCGNHTCTSNDEVNVAFARKGLLEFDANWQKDQHQARALVDGDPILLTSLQRRIVGGQ